MASVPLGLVSLEAAIEGGRGRGYTLARLLLEEGGREVCGQGVLRDSWCFGDPEQTGKCGTSGVKNPSQGGVWLGRGF